MRKRTRHLWLVSLSAFLCFFCTIKDDNGDAVDPGIISTQPTDPDAVPVLFASADSAYVKTGDTIALRIRVRADSASDAQPLSDARVIIGHSRGWVSRDTVVTNADGRATIYFSDTTSGRAEFTITSGTAQQTLRLDVTNTPTKITKRLKAVPLKSIIKADGKDHTIISVQVMNENNNPLVGEAVQFITTSGVIAGEPPATSNSGQSLTDQNGIARAKLISSNVNDTAYVTAYLVNDKSLNDEIAVGFSGVNVNINIKSSNIKENEELVLSAKVLNASGEPIPYAPAYFELGKGLSSNIRVLSADSITGLDGVARLIIKGMETGTDSLVITSSGASSAIKLNVTDLDLQVELEETVLQARQGLSTMMNAVFTEGDGNTLDGKNIVVTRHFKKQNGADSTDTVSMVTDNQGRASMAIKALPYEGTMRLVVTAYNTSSDIATAEAHLEFITTRTMTISALPSVIQADGTSRSTITVQIKNEMNNPIVGDVITFASDAGLITSSAVTDENGKAKAQLTSDRRNTIATVTATLEKDPTRQAKIDVEFSGVTLTAAANPASINSSGSDTSTVAITLVDAAKNPIVGERVNFSKQMATTSIVSRDSVTDNRGEARCRIVGTGSGQDTVTIQAAGAFTRTVVNYSTNYLVVDTASFQPAIANGTDSTQLRIRYMQGDRSTPIDNATLDVSVTMGSIHDTTFARTFTLTPADDGEMRFYLKNPSFTNTATVYVKAKTSQELTTAAFSLYFRASNVFRIELSGTPEVISTNKDRATLTAVAFDHQNNRVKDAEISFNMLNGPGGGEYLDPATATTGADGTAKTHLVSGTTPSMYKQVRISASDFSGIRSDTAKFTIAGPPHEITIRRNMGEITKGDATYGKKVAAIVSDVNGNPVADETEVSFSMQVTGYKIFRLSTHFYWNDAGDKMLYRVDTVSVFLPFEDLNDNYRLDPGEDMNMDGIAARGEDLNGDGILQTGPGFEDINWNGVRDSFPEPIKYFTRADGTEDSVFADYNGNGKRDLVEPLLNDSLKDMTWEEYQALAAAVPRTGKFDIDWNSNGVADPKTALTIPRTVTTKDGVADNEIIYGQSDALRIQVKIWAECRGLVTSSPEQFILPIEKEDAKYWRYKD
ncbi:MAG: Ig-like domain-containing protein [Chitinispirillaceae bacterium]